MDAFSLRKRVIDDYADYVQSFLRIMDPEVERFDNNELSAALAGRPDLAKPLLQVRRHRPGSRGRRHRASPLRATAGQPYVLTTGTGSGSGKSLTYLIPVQFPIVSLGYGRRLELKVVVQFLAAGLGCSGFIRAMLLVALLTVACLERVGVGPPAHPAPRP